MAKKGQVVSFMLSLAMLSAAALAAGGIYLLRRGGARRQAWLMLAMALVLIGNVVILTVPLGSGTAP